MIRSPDADQRVRIAGRSPNVIWIGIPLPSDFTQTCGVPFASLVFGDGMGGTIQTGAMLCAPINTCDALTPASCGKPGTACEIVDPTGATACVTEGAGGAGEPCPCKGGFTCIAGGSGSTCRRLCKAVEGGGEPYCQAGEGVCVHFNRDPPGVGECTPGL